MEIRLAGSPFSVTMRTPGQDFDLVAGFLLSEGVIWHPDQVRRLDYSTSIGADGLRDFNTVEVTLSPGVALPNTATAQELFNACAAHGGKGWDHSAMVRALEKMSNFEIGQKAA